MALPFTQTLDITRLKVLSKEVLNSFLQTSGESPEESKADALKKAESLYGDAPLEPTVIPDDAEDIEVHSCIFGTKWFEDATPLKAAKLIAKIVQSWSRGHPVLVWYRQHRAHLHNACDVFRQVRYVYGQLGPCNAESHYQVALAKELETAVWHGGVRLGRNSVSCESVGPIRYLHSDGTLLTIDKGLSSRTDIVVSDADANLRLILELKAAGGLKPENYAQLRRYLKEAKITGQGDFKGLLVLFGSKNCSVVAFDKSAENMKLFTYEEQLKTNWYEY
uniref:PD-(D/E)XK nuclease superfamily protein n=1 Tax=viral metagenome TaxID=1070528 RepID=A0A6C0K8F2_9ZZZZ